MQVLIFCELGLKMRFHTANCFLWSKIADRGGAMLIPNELVLTFEGCYVSATFGENRSRNATVRVYTQTDKRTNAVRDRLNVQSVPRCTLLTVKRPVYNQV